MFVRVVRFTDANTERVQRLLKRIEESDGPPPGVKIAAMKFLVDDSQQTAISVQEFETAEDMSEGGKIFAAMDSAETPGTRVSVDECELKLDLRP
jgi:hypothetical protein